MSAADRPACADRRAARHAACARPRRPRAAALSSRPRQIGLQEIVGHDQPAAAIAVEQMVPAREPEVLHGAAQAPCGRRNPLGFIPVRSARKGEDRGDAVSHAANHSTAARIFAEGRMASFVYRRGLIALMLMVGMTVGMDRAAQAQTYPAKPIHIVVPFAPGGITDVVARALGQRLSEAWKQQVVVENTADRRRHCRGRLGRQGSRRRPHAAGRRRRQFRHGSPHTYSKLPYDAFKDFAPISGLGISPQALIVHPSVPANTFGRADRARQSEAGRAQLRNVRHRHQRPSQHRALGKHDRRQVHARALSRRDARPDRHDRRATSR